MNRALVVALLAGTTGCAAIGPALSRTSLTTAEATLAIDEAVLVYDVKVKAASYSAKCITNDCRSDAARKAYEDIYPRSLIHDDCVASYNRASSALNAVLVCEETKKTCATEQALYVNALADLALRMRLLKPAAK